MTTATASLPGPSYVTGMTIGSLAPGEPAGRAVTGLGPARKTVSPAAFTYAIVSASGSPVVGAELGITSESANDTESASEGKFTSVSLATDPSSLRSTTRTRVNGTALPAPCTTRITDGICGASAMLATRRPKLIPFSGPVTSRPQESRERAKAVVRTTRRCWAGRSTQYFLTNWWRGGKSTSSRREATGHQPRVARGQVTPDFVRCVDQSLGPGD